MKFPTMTINENSKLAYFKDEYYTVIGSHVKIAVNDDSLLLFNEKKPLESVLASIETIHADIQHAIEMNNKKEK